MAGRQIKCEGCSVVVAASGVQFDDQGRSLCRKCIALEVSQAANETQQRYGARRRCRRCDGIAMVTYSETGTWLGSALAGSVLFLVALRDILVRQRHPTS